MRDILTRCTAVIAALGCFFFGCNTIIGLELGEPEPATPCLVDGDCRDDNPCTSATCSASKLCEIVPVQGMVPDDANPCTIDRCDGSTAAHEPQSDGVSCMEGPGSGLCLGGQCVIPCNESNAMVVCDDAQPCTDDRCDLAVGKCARTRLDGVETPGVVPPPGDCQQRRCVEGVDTALADDADTPTDLACFDEACSGGVPSTTPSAVGTPCGDGSLLCDGSGACTGCTDPSQCNAGSFCIDGVCVECLTADACPDADPTDCLLPSCSPAGACDTAPGVLNQPCTSGGGTVCNGTGDCVECNSPDQCLDPGECKLASCTSEFCALVEEPQGTPCTNGVCQDGVCKLSTGQPCVASGDCLSGNCSVDDDVCCDLPCGGDCKSCATGTCVNAADGTDPENECLGPQTCNGMGMCGP